MTTKESGTAVDPAVHHGRFSRTLAPLRDFLRTEASGGALLLVGTAIALIWANTPWKAAYHSIWSTEFGVSLGRYAFSMDLQHWVNDGLMTIFFLVVGLEIKREATSGHLATRQTLMLPLVAALGGMAIPAVTYLLIAGGEASRGWGVPMATDIALAVGVLSLLGARVRASGRAFLLGLAVVDDIGAIIVIAIFYSKGFTFGWFLLALAALAAVGVLRMLRVNVLLAYLPFGVLAWFGLYEAGVHPTIAGVVMGLITPLTPYRGAEAVDIEDVKQGKPATDSVSVVEWLQHVLHPWSGFVIVPVFALANAGLEISLDSLADAVRSPVAWGVFCGLVVGKPVGVLVASLAAKRAGIALLPEGTTGRGLLGIGHAAGIGFTVALFISELAFTSEAHRADAKLAILAASLVSALLAVGVLWGRTRVKVEATTEPNLSGVTSG